MGNIVICGLPGSTIFLNIFFTNSMFFEKRYWTWNAFSLSTILSETFLILWRTERDKVKNVLRSACKAPVSLSYINETWIFGTDIRRIFKYQISWKSLQWKPSCSMPTDDRYDEANSRFSQFFERAEKLFLTIAKFIRPIYCRGSLLLFLARWNRRECQFVAFYL
jgi:hypothetical protein